MCLHAKKVFDTMKTMDIQEKRFKVKKIVYYNSQRASGVLGLKPVDDLGNLGTILVNRYGDVTACGSFIKPEENEEVIISGEIVTHNTYGKQIDIKALDFVDERKKTVSENSDSTFSKEGFIDFLAKSDVAGVDVKIAEKIYDAFGDKSLNVVTERPEDLLEIKGIGKKTVEKIKSTVGYTRKHKRTINFLLGLGLYKRIISKLIGEFGEETISIIKNNPFEILRISKELSFKQVDLIYLKNNGDPKAPIRLENAFLYLLKQQATMEGSTGCLRDTLSKKFYTLLNISGSEDYFGNTMDSLEKDGKIVLGKGVFVYYKEYLEIEKEIANKVLSLKDIFMPSKKIKEYVIEEEIKNFPFELNKQQVKAIYDCLDTNIAVLTGAAGSGKSSITKALYRIYVRCGFNVELLSPTAKACRRLEECTGGVASTIHRFLKLSKEGDSFFGGNYEKDTVLIIDEASMMDIMLFNYLLKGATMSTRILLVGDNNQLPSVQAGNVLGDVIDSGKVHVSLLTDIMRQQENSNIIRYCSMINEGKIFEPCESSDFLYEEFGTADELKEKLLSLYVKEVNEVGLNEVQVIAPYKKGEVGMDNLNMILQQTINGSAPEVLASFRVGDKVRHTENNYKKDVYNGETGVVTEFDSEKEIINVDYGYKVISYNKSDIDELKLSYASTVHSSQGSEYKIVFVILDDTSVNNFLHIRRLLYTAVSRGKSKVYILTKPYLVDNCIKNNSYRPRITKLRDFLEGEYD